VAVVKGVARAQKAIDDFAKHLTEDERKKGIFLLLGIHVESGRLRMDRTLHMPF
jgi:hypothetical protein